MRVAMVCAGFTVVRPTSCASRWRHSSSRAASAGSRTNSSPHGEERLHLGICRKDIQPARRFWLLWISRKPCSVVRADRLCFQLHQMPLSGVSCAALINSQPMGFYAPAQIVGDARAHGVEVRPVCINRSRWDCTLEPIGNTGRHAVRLGFRQVKGLAIADAARIVAARMNSDFVSVDDMWRRSGVPTEALVQLAPADDYNPSLKLERRDALWAIKALRDEPLPLFAAAANARWQRSRAARARGCAQANDRGPQCHRRLWAYGADAASAPDGLSAQGPSAQNIITCMRR